MRADGIRNYQQSPNFGYMQVPQELYEGDKKIIESDLSETLGDIHGHYLGKYDQLGLDSSDNVSYYFSTKKGPKVERSLIDKLNKKVACDGKKIEFVDWKIANAAKKLFNKDLILSNNLLNRIVKRMSRNSFI